MKNQQIKISNINIFPVAQQETLLGFGSCVVNEVLRISGIALHTTLQGQLKICFPAKKISRGLTFYIQPLDSETSELFRSAFEEEAKKVGLFNLGLENEKENQTQDN